MGGGDPRLQGVVSLALEQFFRSVCVQDMTQAVAQFLGEVEQLSEKERNSAIFKKKPMSE